MVAISLRASVLVAAVAIVAGCKSERERDTATCEAAKVRFSVEYLKSGRSVDATRTRWQNLKRIAEEGQRACSAIGDAETAAKLGNSVQVANELLKRLEDEANAPVIE